ncbi:hypothetical protein [Bradyrhizobium cytisi]|uniref:Uncharacterized protein n=1 Tax=Bradyrhizobium cytisi TaxID=515489 RepID=A0A5S4W3Z7_9BRAD|nr:hypothetical protein [Bradyrhizobium cytisi]TYL74597.1 hypothetical protein FXB38_34370 [Bradyrhizobium cytisi]
MVDRIELTWVDQQGDFVAFAIRFKSSISFVLEWKPIGLPGARIGFRQSRCKPVVLMSATPFRIGLKPFRVDAQNIDIYQFGEAVGEGTIRDVA